MSDEERPRNPAFADLRPEIVIKPDGRYLIYYADAEDFQDASAGDGRGATPAQAPWSPEGGPAHASDEGAATDV